MVSGNDLHRWCVEAIKSCASAVGSCITLCVSSALLVLCGSVAIAEPISAESFHAKVQALYNFAPHTLGSKNFPAKSAQLDEFWSYVKANTVEALPRLRSELSDASNSQFFYYDGGKLLFSLSKDRSDQNLVLRSLPKVDLLDIDPSDYLRNVHWFASNGFDTRDAAFRILDYPDFKAFVPQHALTLAQDYAFIYMTFPASEKAYLPVLVERLKVERNPQSQKSLLLALWYTVLPEGVVAIKDFSGSLKTSSELVTYARELLARSPGTGATSNAASALRVERMKLMQRPISDEALHEFDGLTMKLLKKQ